MFLLECCSGEVGDRKPSLLERDKDGEEVVLGGLEGSLSEEES